MSEHAASDFDFEGLLRQALAPVDPPEDLAQRLERTLWNLTELAVDELEGWELRSMRDPRNWVRPVAAAAIGSGAAVGLVLVRTRRRRHRRRREADSALDLVARTLRDLGREARRVADDVL